MGSEELALARAIVLEVSQHGCRFCGRPIGDPDVEDVRWASWPSDTSKEKVAHASCWDRVKFFIVNAPDNVFSDLRNPF